MRKIITFVLTLVALIGVLGMVLAAEQSVATQVQVNEYVSVTITPCGTTLSFGSGNPGDYDLGITCQSNSTAAISIRNEAISNKAIKVETKGTDLNNSGVIIPVSNIEFDEANSKTSATTLSTAYQTSTNSLAVNSTSGVWYWLDIPLGKGSGTYTTALYIKAA